MCKSSSQKNQYKKYICFIGGSKNGSYIIYNGGFISSDVCN